MKHEVNISKLVKKLLQISLFEVNALDHLIVQQCNSAEQILLLCGMKLFLEYNTSLFFINGQVSADTFDKLACSYAILPSELRYVLEQQGCRIYLNMLGHDDIVSHASIARCLFLIENFDLEFKSFSRRPGTLNEESYRIASSNRWRKISLKRRRAYNQTATLLLLDEKDHRNECLHAGRILGCHFAPFHNFRRFSQECKDIRARNQQKQSNTLDVQIANAWKNSTEQNKLYCMDKAFREHFTNMFTKKVAKKYELRSRAVAAVLPY
ncbi:hypothetical protein XU18_1776 [Perkinsela sp. CCAP 1560/4]|nr:hypothetical protein XU18_1776 [Perkinsela sp. CCAP 1560/4]|eukprot:KNH07555.1 hypothetical protein XU18_1776 [Perkinsela sp. CCAP 1560/4]